MKEIHTFYQKRKAKKRRKRLHTGWSSKEGWDPDCGAGAGGGWGGTPRWSGLYMVWGGIPRTGAVATLCFKKLKYVSFFTN